MEGSNASLNPTNATIDAAYTEVVRAPFISGGGTLSCIGLYHPGIVLALRPTNVPDAPPVREAGAGATYRGHDVRDRGLRIWGFSPMAPATVAWPTRGA